MHRKIKFPVLVFMVIILTIVPLSTALAGTGVTPRPATEYVKPGDSYSIKAGNITVSGNNFGLTGGNFRVRHGCPVDIFEDYHRLSNCQRLSSDFVTTTHVCFRIPPGQAQNDLYIAVQYGNLEFGFWTPVIEFHSRVRYACADIPLWPDTSVDVYLVAKK